jgi:hypothetical protein
MLLNDIIIINILENAIGIKDALSLRHAAHPVFKQGQHYVASTSSPITAAEARLAWKLATSIRVVGRANQCVQGHARHAHVTNMIKYGAGVAAH